MTVIFIGLVSIIISFFILCILSLAFGVLFAIFFDTFIRVCEKLNYHFTFVYRNDEKNDNIDIL